MSNVMNTNYPLINMKALNSEYAHMVHTTLQQPVSMERYYFTF